jgi:hypothetical protein
VVVGSAGAAEAVGSTAGAVESAWLFEPSLSPQAAAVMMTKSAATTRSRTFPPPSARAHRLLRT